MADVTLLDAAGRPIKREALNEPQTAHLTHLQREMQTHPTRGLTPSRLASILDQAENGDLLAQFDLFEDMEEKDGHIAAELGKRRRALLVDWALVPPDNPTAQEKRLADQLTELLGLIDDFEDVLFDITDGIGKGFACLEMEWGKSGKLWVPKTITHRPQSWFTVHRGYRQELRLRSNTVVDGVVGDPLQPLGWITHVHKAKSGYLERTSLMRQLVWPYLFKNYSLGDLAEFLEIYGIPVRIGTYPTSASEKEKMSLLRTLAGIGHNAAGVIAEGMMLDFKAATSGDPDAFELMINWCERTQSKVILGGTLTSGADGKSSTNALGNVHNEVRKDLRDSDIRQVCTTVTRDLVHAMAAANGLLAGGAVRCPVFRLDVGETEDLTAFAAALPKLVGIGLEIPQQWAQERLGIPQPKDGEAVLRTSAAPATTPVDGLVPGTAAATGVMHVGGNKRVAALTGEAGAAPSDGAPQATPPVVMAGQLANNVRTSGAAWVEQIKVLVQHAQSLEDVRDGLDKLLPDMSLDEYARAMAEALAAARLAGRYEVLQEAAGRG